MVSVLTQEARSRMTGRLPEPGTNPDDYARTKERLKAAYAKSKMERCAELLSITSLGDRSPEHLLSYMQGLLPGETMSGLLPSPTPSTRCFPPTTEIWRRSRSRQPVC